MPLEVPFLDIAAEYEAIQRSRIRYDMVSAEQDSYASALAFVETYASAKPARARHIKLAALFCACGRWDNANSPVALIQKILDTDPSLANTYDHLGATPLMCAVRWGEQLSTYVLLHYGANPRMINHETHLHKSPYYVGSEGMNAVEISIRFDRYDPALTAMLIRGFSEEEILTLNNYVGHFFKQADITRIVSLSKEPLPLKSLAELDTIDFMRRTTLENQLCEFLRIRAETELRLGSMAVAVDSTAGPVVKRHALSMG